MHHLACTRRKEGPAAARSGVETPSTMVVPESPADAFRDLHATYAPGCAQGQVLCERVVALCGVVAEPPRSHSPKLGFMLLRAAASHGAAPCEEGQSEPDAADLQVVMNVKFADKDEEDLYSTTWRLLGCGDLVLVEGHPGKTRTGTRAEGFSLFAARFTIQRMAPDADRALRLLLQLPSAADRDRCGELRGTAAAQAAATAAIAESTPAEHELRRLLCSMTHEQHATAQVLQLLQTVAAPRLERRRREDRLAVEGTATAAAVALELEPDELPVAGVENSGGQLGEARMQRIRTVAARRQRGLVVVLEDVDQPANVGAALRTCDAFGVATVCHIRSRDSGMEPSAAFELDDPVVHACSKSASMWLNHRSFESTAACITWLKAEGIPSAATTPPHDELQEWSGMQQQQQQQPGEGDALEGDARSAPEPATDLDVPLPPHRVTELYSDVVCSSDSQVALPWGGPRLAIWYGNESRGLSHTALRLVRESSEAGCMTVPMLGMVESLNIAATVAVCLTEVTRQRGVRRAQLLRDANEAAAAYEYEGEELHELVQHMVAIATS
jgi:tRNA G18 (ribose-2'-O)-methylase SpoU